VVEIYAAGQNLELCSTLSSRLQITLAGADLRNQFQQVTDCVPSLKPAGSP
jgi:hypothetical protein